MVSLVCEGIPKISVSTVGGDAFSTRLYWHDSTASSFTRVRCMTTSCCMTPQVFGSLKKSYTVPSRLNGHSREPHLISLGELEEELQLTHAGYGELGPVCESKVNPSRSASVESGGSAGVPQTCCACGKAFDSADVVVMFESSVFHVACFCCGQCGAEVDANQRFLVLGDGCPLCYDCSPACHACGEKITGSHIGVLNKDFHEGCLKCFQCDKPFVTISKVYASAGEPCCAECVTPVFDETWSPRCSLGMAFPLPASGDDPWREGGSSYSSPCSPAHRTLPPKLETLSRTVRDLPLANQFPSLLRPSVSAPVLGEGRLDSNSKVQKLSLSSLEAILLDELGVSLFMNFCVEDSSIELVIFWLDVEHFKYFDGDTDDMRLFAHHIMLKYIGYYAELPVGLPKSIENTIFEDVQKTFSQDIFTEAQRFVCEEMERKVLPRFLQSSDGRAYLQALVSRDNDRRQKTREASDQATSPMSAIVIRFDKRHLSSKFYVYEIRVELEGSTFTIFRRYSEFHSLHDDLKASFPRACLPPMPKKIYFGRSQTRTVAEQRMKELQAYLQCVLAMPTMVSCSYVLKQFLTQTQTDREDEAFGRRLQESQRIAK